ncbi:hypothetical protein MRX96_013429 [Rhipicephalus microplus]
MSSKQRFGASLHYLSGFGHHCFCTYQISLCTRCPPNPKGQSGVMYLLDVLAQLAYFEADCLESVVERLAALLNNVAEQATAQLSMKTWPTVVPFDSAPSFSWFALVGLLAEAALPSVMAMWEAVLRTVTSHECTGHSQKGNAGALGKGETTSDGLSGSFFSKCSSGEEKGTLPKILCERLMRVYGAFGLWLEDKQVLGAHDSLASLPSQYCPELLCATLQGNSQLWHELVSMEAWKSRLQVLELASFSPAVPSLGKWQNGVAAAKKAEIFPLRTYENPIPAPRVPRLTPCDPACADCRIRMVRLYLNLAFHEASQDPAILLKIKQNRTEWLATVTVPPYASCCAIVQLEACLTQLVQRHRQALPTDKAALEVLGSNIFFDIVQAAHKEITSYSPTRQFVTLCLDMLGQEFVSNKASQCLPVLQAMLREPGSISHVSPFFTPAAADDEQYVHMYHLLSSYLVPGPPQPCLCIAIQVCPFPLVEKPCAKSGCTRPVAGLLGSDAKKVWM